VSSWEISANYRIAHKKIKTNYSQGHESNEAKDGYEKRLIEKSNIEIVWQVPNSPETNMLDLGAWMCIQSFVEYFS
jgi:hypothetical protein